MKWEDVAEFVVNPQRTLELAKETEKISVELEESWGLGLSLGGWNVPNLHASWWQLGMAYTRENNAANDSKFSYTCQQLNVGGTIGARCFNIFQHRDASTPYLEYLEILTRSQVLKTELSSYMIMSMREDVSSLALAARVINGACKIKDVSCHLIRFGGGKKDEEPPRKLFRPRCLSKIVSACNLEEGQRVNLIIANCTLHNAKDTNDMMKDNELFKENQQILSIIALALDTLSPNDGSLIIRLHGSQDGFFASNMFVLFLLFKEVSILKSLVGKDAEMSLFVVAKGFQGHDHVKLQDRISEKFESILDLSFKGQKYFPFTQSQIPSWFINKLESAICPFFKFVTDCKNRTATYVDERNSKMDERMQRILAIKDEQASRYKIKTSIAWFLAIRPETIYHPKSKKDHPRDLSSDNADRAHVDNNQEASSNNAQSTSDSKGDQAAGTPVSFDDVTPGPSSGLVAKPGPSSRI